MRLPTSVDRFGAATAARLTGWPAIRYSASVRISLWLSVLVAAGLFGWGAWQRRWMADDGLIVLRTVRNLLAGNGPVFNAGERVESNTSTLWTYLITAASWIAGPVRLEYVALALALGLSVAGVVLVMLGTARLYAPALAGRRAVLLPAGVLVYIAVPPARDFASSGLENGLVLAYVGLLWWLLVRWSQARADTGPVLTAALAFVAGQSVLVRPELALVGGVALVMMVLAAPGWGRRLLIIAAGGALPVAYQIFRMGYYGLLVPQTAIAKDASGAKWSQGLIYLNNLNSPYLLWVPLVLLVVVAVLLVWGRPGQTGPASQGAAANRPARILQNPTAVVVFIVASGVIQAVYWVRQGGDFMHGRVLLTALFLVLAPVAVIPIALPQRPGLTVRTGYLVTGSMSLLWLAVAGWAVWAANSPGMGSDATRVTYTGIVDERRFYAQATGHAHPLTAADYLDYPRMRAVLVALRNTPDGALLLPSGNYDVWDVVPAIPPPPDKPRPPGETGPHTVFFTNMGMLGMNVGLDVRVIDQIGLTNPLAAHTARLEDARIGHDKNLFPDWAVAEGPFLKERPYIPPYLDEEWIAQAEVALKCPDTEAMLNAVRSPLGPRRFLSNIIHAMDFGSYRIDRVPLYELRRCGLEIPPPETPEYTGLPATGP